MRIYDEKLISILLTFAFAFGFMTGCSAAETENQFTLTMKIGNPVMTVNGEEKNIDENGTAPVIESG